MRRLDRWLVALLAWGALSFGGVYPWGYWSIAAAAAGIGGWIFVGTHAWGDRRIRAMALLFAVVVLTVAVQAVPIPLSLMVQVSPAADRVLRASNLQYLIDPPRWHALSLSPDATVTAAGVVASLALLLSGLTYVMGRLKLDRLVVGITAVGAALAVFAVMQRAADIRSLDNDRWKLVYGFWKPAQAGDVFGPFINRNHFAGWMVMTVSLALGYSCAVLQSSGLSWRDGWRRWLRWTLRPEASRFVTLALAVALMGAALTASGSRSGIASFAVSVAVVAYFAGRRLERRRLRVFAMGYLGVLLIGAVAWAGAGQAANRFALATTDAGSRLGAWRDTLRVVGDFPLVGTGIGGYGQAMLVYQTGDRETFYAHAHNDYLQVAAEGGLLVGVPVLWCLVSLVRRVSVRVRNATDAPDVFWIRAGAVAGIAGIAAQSFVDFSLQLAGNAVLFVVLVAIALHRPQAERALGRHAVSHAPRV